jgi:integrase
MSSENKAVLPKYCYVRGNVIWVSYKNENGKWVKRSTNCKANEIERARRFVNALLKGVEIKIQRSGSAVRTVSDYVHRWLSDRERRGIASVVDDRGRLEKYALPYVGHISLDDVRPRHIRDMVRQLRELRTDAGEPLLAPRTIHHVYNTLHNVFEAAIVDEIYMGANPVKVAPGELPKKVDKDREWRAEATYTVGEVERLLSAPLIPVERRVMYALKALAGLRHGEAAALCLRHLDFTAEPLPRLHVVQAWCSRHHVVKSTKTEETRTVPVHPELSRILRAWLSDHWPRVYGRVPSIDDFVVPTRTGRCVAGKDSNDAFKRDLASLELRVKAGKYRDRGGHDLRSWYETRCIEDGAEFLLLRRTTHAAPKTVAGGYERFSWAALCRQIEKLRISLPEDPLALGTGMVQLEKRGGARWTSVVTPSGLEGDSARGRRRSWGDVTVENSNFERPRANTHEYYRRTEPVTLLSTAARMLERAIRTGDAPRALEIVEQLRELGDR